MGTIEQLISQRVKEIVVELYGQEIDEKLISIQRTSADFEGDLTVVVFPFVRFTKKSPEITGAEIGEALTSSLNQVVAFNVIKGFLNLVVSDEYWTSHVFNVSKERNYGFNPEKTGKTIMVEFSSPNTNKPLHLGHVRNNLLGQSVAAILEANGHKVIKANLINDRGIHICKTMLAWKKWSNQETPESTDKKGDHFVGNYYVLFEKNLKAEMAQLIEQGMTEEDARKNSNLMQQAQEMLRLWEDKDMETIQLWRKMNSWVYQGFDETYERMGISFDKVYHESETYMKGKDIVKRGLETGLFITKLDGSVWIDLTDEGLDEKLLLRADGTSVYMTQDLGTALLRNEEFTLDKNVYVVGNEQDYHFNVLKLILLKMGYAWAEGLYHMSYGMVDLPSGKMKSREGKVVDADDLMDEMVSSAKAITVELGKTDGMSYQEAQELYKTIGLGALKYYILKVDPKKNITFNPEESIDFNGNTGPFIQYTYARIQSILRKADELRIDAQPASHLALNKDEKSLIRCLHEYPSVIANAGAQQSPALIANFVYEFVKEYNHFYHNCSILKEENVAKRDFRLILSKISGDVIKSAMHLLGIDVPFRM